LGKLINKSSTGSGELKELVLEIYLPEKCLDVPMEMADDIDSNYRFLPHGRYPSPRLWFKKYPTNITNQEIAGKQAEIRLSVVGQPDKTYKTRIAKTIKLS
jgi:hypothetical protein